MLGRDTLPLNTLCLAKLGLVEEPAGEGEAWLAFGKRRLPALTDPEWWGVVDCAGGVDDFQGVGAGCGGCPGCGGAPGVGWGGVSECFRRPTSFLGSRKTMKFKIGGESRKKI